MPEWFKGFGCNPEIRGFESHLALLLGAEVVQWQRRISQKDEVVGSSPTLGIMSRTVRNKPWKFLRHMKTTNTRRGEMTSKNDIHEEGYRVDNRHEVRGSITNKRIPTTWDDVFPNYYDEVPKGQQK